MEDPSAPHHALRARRGPAEGPTSRSGPAPGDTVGSPLSSSRPGSTVAMSPSAARPAGVPRGPERG